MKSTRKVQRLAGTAGRKVAGKRRPQAPGGHTDEQLAKPRQPKVVGTKGRI